MKQSSANEIKNILSTVFGKKLSADEKELLNEKEFINQKLYEQWSASGSSAQGCKSSDDFTLNGVMNRIHRKRTSGSGLYRRWGWIAAVVLLLIGSSLTFLFLNGRQPVETYTLCTGYKSVETIKLSDGTLVTLGSCSKLTYPKTFSSGERSVRLSGQAFFQVRHDAKHPFVVKTKSMNITDLGTAFEVFSYDGDTHSEAVLWQGKVSVRCLDCRKMEKNKSFTLQPNQKLSVAANSAVQIENIVAENYSSWYALGQPSFKNAKLSMIIPRLEKWYGKQIVCSPEISEHYRFTFTVHDDSLETILDMMASSANLKMKVINGNSYKLE